MIRKILVAVALAAGFFATQSAAHAEGLYFKNLTSEKVFIAVANFESGGWRIDGWYSVDPTKTVQIMSGKLDQRYYYYYAFTQSNRSVWEGNHNFFIHPTNSFTILRVNGQYGALPQGAVMKGFREVDTGPTATTWTVTLY